MPELGNQGIELHNNRAYWNGTEVSLTLNEFKLVSFLVQEERDITYRQLYNVVREENFIVGYGDKGCDRAIASYITRIRKKFLNLDPEFNSIRNYHNFGYRWSKQGEKS